MATLTHFCRKDFSFAKHVLLGSWVVFLVAALMPRFITGALAEFTPAILGPLLAVQCFQIFASVLKILRADSFSGGNAFIGTRPVTKTTLWLSKLVGIAALVLLPWLLAKMIAVLAAGVRLSASDWALLVGEETLWFGTVAAVALVAGTHTRQFAWTVLLTIALGACVLWLAVSLFNRPGGLNFITEARHLKASQWLVAQALIMCSGLALSWLWITRRSSQASVTAGALFAGLVFLGSKQWDINFIERLAATQTTVKPRISWVGDARVSETSRNSVSFTTLSRTIKVDGIPEGWIAFPAGVKSQARFADGTTVSGDTANSPTHGDATRALLPSLGHPRLTEPTRPLDGDRFTFFEGEKRLVREKAGMPCKLRGEALVELHEPILIANLPARSGESAAYGGFRYFIGRVEELGGVVTVEITAAGVGLSSRNNSQGSQDDIEVFIVNPHNGFHTRIGFRSGGTSGGPGWFFLTRDYLTEMQAVPEDRRLDFLKDARLYLIGRRYRGTVRVPFEIPDVDLNSGQ